MKDESKLTVTYSPKGTELSYQIEVKNAVDPAKVAAGFINTLDTADSFGPAEFGGTEDNYQPKHRKDAA